MPNVINSLFHNHKYVSEYLIFILMLCGFNLSDDDAASNACELYSITIPFHQ